MAHVGWVDLLKGFQWWGTAADDSFVPSNNQTLLAGNPPNKIEVLSSFNGNITELDSGIFQPAMFGRAPEGKSDSCASWHSRTARTASLRKVHSKPGALPWLFADLLLQRRVSETSQGNAWDIFLGFGCVWKCCCISRNKYIYIIR